MGRGVYMQNLNTNYLSLLKLMMVDALVMFDWLNWYMSFKVLIEYHFEQLSVI